MLMNRVLNLCLTINLYLYRMSDIEQSRNAYFIKQFGRSANTMDVASIKQHASEGDFDGFTGIRALALAGLCSVTVMMPYIAILNVKGRALHCGRLNIAIA